MERTKYLKPSVKTIVIDSHCMVGVQSDGSTDENAAKGMNFDGEGRRNLFEVE